MTSTKSQMDENMAWYVTEPAWGNYEADLWETSNNRWDDIHATLPNISYKKNSISVILFKYNEMRIWQV